MILSIAHKGLKLLWTKNDSSWLPPLSVTKIKNILTLLNNAENFEDMNFPGSGLHPLKGELKDYWAVHVSVNFRIVFKMENGSVYLVNYIDYH